MALVDYPSSDEAEGDVSDGEREKNSTAPIPTPAPSSIPSSPTRKRRHSPNPPSSSPSLLPPLPSKFHDLYASSARPSTRDDPSLHGGRKRVTPHVEGNWPTHVYIEWYPTTTEHSLLTDLLASLKDAAGLGVAPGAGAGAGAAVGEIHSSLTSDLGAPLPLHISLSRSIGFLTEQKDAFAASLDTAIKTCGVRPFEISLTSLAWVPNFEQTRWFLVLRLARPETDGLNRLLHVTNSVVQRNGQPPLYADEKSTPSSLPFPLSSSLPPLPPPSSKKLDPNPGKQRGNNTPKRGRGGCANSKASSTTAINWSSMRDLSRAFHFSIAWTLSAPSEELRELTAGLVEGHKHKDAHRNGDGARNRNGQGESESEGEGNGQFDDIKKLRVTVEEIKSKIGNVVTSLPLRKNQAESKGLFGL